VLWTDDCLPLLLLLHVEESPSLLRLPPQLIWWHLY
jgi:hypothetical protein